MNVTTHTGIPVYTVSGSSTARELPDWLIRKRKRSLKKDPEFANRVELLQGFDFPGVGHCVRVSPDGNWVMSTGDYQPQIRGYYLPNLALSYARHTESHNVKFLILSEDNTKTLHLQNDRYVEFHKPGGCFYRLRIPRYGRDIVYNKSYAEALVPAVGVNDGGMGEVYRFNCELGRFMQPYEVEVGGDDMLTPGAGSLQGGINTGAVNCASIAETTHNLVAFGTSIGTVEYFDPRCHGHVSALAVPRSSFDNSTPEVTALEFHSGGLTIAAGDSTGMTYIYDLRKLEPLQRKDQGYGFPIKNLKFLEPSTRAGAHLVENKILSADKRIIKIWDQHTSKTWTSVEPTVDMNCVEWVPDSGMLLAATESPQQHIFFIPQLGPAPKWCTFLDNIVEEMAEDSHDPNAYGKLGGGEVYDNYKFLTMPQLQHLNIDHLIGTANLFRPYMHGYFVPQRLYEEASLISNPTLWQDQRAKSIKSKIEKERESRIRGKKQVKVKLNKKLAERILEREEKNEKRKAKRLLAKAAENEGEEGVELEPVEHSEETLPAKKERNTLLTDSRFAALFEDPEFEIDETSREFGLLNPSTKIESKIPKGLTAVDKEELDSAKSDSNSENESSDDASESASEFDRNARTTKQSKTPFKTAAPSKKRLSQPKMVVSQSGVRKVGFSKNKSFGARLAGHSERPRHHKAPSKTIVGEQQISFVPGGKPKQQRRVERNDRPYQSKKDRRSASGNAFRGM